VLPVAAVRQAFRGVFIDLVVLVGRGHRTNV
jgi:hypothetical protein